MVVVVELQALGVSRIYPQQVAVTPRQGCANEIYSDAPGFTLQRYDHYIFIMAGGRGDQLGDGGGGSCLEEKRAQRVSFQQSQRADHDYQTRQPGL